MNETRKRGLIAGLSALLTLAAAEGALRLREGVASGQGSPSYAGGSHARFLIEEDPETGYRLRPGFQGREISSGGEFDVAASIDERGLRDHPHAPPPQPAVLALGDSMTFGEGVEAGQSFAAVLERESGVRVYNAGVPGFGTCQMAVHARRLIPALQPKVVLVTFQPRWDRNRCATPYRYLEGFLVDPGFGQQLHLVGGNLVAADLPGRAGALTAELKGRSHVARYAFGALGDLVRRNARKPYAPPEPAAFEPTIQALQALRRQADEAGAGFLAVLIDGSRSKPDAGEQAMMEAILQQKGIPYLALDRTIQDADWSRFRFERDLHWNEAGHRAVGVALSPVVRSLLFGS